MTKEQALHNFWSSFDVPAYDRNTVPEDAELPYITYEVTDGNMFEQNVITGIIWDRSTSWANVTAIKDKVANLIGLGGYTANYDNGLMWIKRATPFAQRLAGEEDGIREIVINVEIEYESEV